MWDRLIGTSVETVPTLRSRRRNTMYGCNIRIWKHRDSSPLVLYWSVVSQLVHDLTRLSFSLALGEDLG